MPKLRPRKIFSVGPFETDTSWYGPIARNPHPDRPTRIRVMRHAGGRNKAPMVYEATIAGGSVPTPQRIPLPAGRILYITMYPPVPEATAYLEPAGQPRLV